MSERSPGRGFSEKDRNGARKGYFAILRLYGPTEAAFDKSWKPGDIEKMK